MNILTAVSICAIFITGCGQINNSNGKSAPVIPKPEEQKKDTVTAIQNDTIKGRAKLKIQNKYFPFELPDTEKNYQIVAQIESPALYPKYYDLFKKYNYEGNGYCWEGHITQILEKLDTELLHHIDFDSEAGSFYATTDTRANQLRFVQVLSPIFYDLKKLESWIKKADHSRIDD